MLVPLRSATQPSKIVCRIQVIFTGFINHAQETALIRLGGKDAIGFAHLQIFLLPFANAPEHKTNSFFWICVFEIMASIQKLFDFHGRRPMPWASYQ